MIEMIKSLHTNDTSSEVVYYANEIDWLAMLDANDDWEGENLFKK